MTAASFQEKFLSLHKVHWDTDLWNGTDKERGGWVCDCKGFVHSVVCSHVIVVQHVRGEVDIDEAMEKLPEQRRRGRKRNATKALIRQPEDTPTQSNKQGRGAGGGKGKGKKWGSTR